MIKIGVIGSGWIAEEMVNGIGLCPDMCFAAMYSRTEEKGRAFADKFGSGIPVYTDIRLFAQADIDAVYIASPNVFHYGQSRLMLENGKHVLCEKPVTETPAEYCELAALAEEKGLIYTEAIMMMHQPDLIKLKQAVKSIGRITTAHFDFSQLSSKYRLLVEGKNPNIFNPEMKTGCLRDLGIYCVYPAVELFGMPERITSSAGLLETGADGYGTAILDYPDRQVTLTYSKTGQNYYGSQIFGDRGTVKIGSVSQLTDISVCYADGRTEKICGETEKHVLMGYEAQAFYNYITDYKTYESEYLYKRSLTRDVLSVMQTVKEQCGIE